MALRRGRFLKSPPPRLYLGEWLSRLDRKPAEICKQVGITESYLSELISNKKKNPASHVMFAISELLGLAVNDLYRPPPPVSATAALDHLNPAQLAGLGALLDRIKTSKSR
jgi:transcriptional regulator with XRE-family HTH domain